MSAVAAAAAGGVRLRRRRCQSPGSPTLRNEIVRIFLDFFYEIGTLLNLPPVPVEGQSEDLPHDVEVRP